MVSKEEEEKKMLELTEKLLCMLVRTMGNLVVTV